MDHHGCFLKCGLVRSGEEGQKLIRHVKALNQGGEHKDSKQVVRFSLQTLGRNCPQVEGERYFSGFLLFTLEQMGLGGRCYVARNIQEYSL